MAQGQNEIRPLYTRTGVIGNTTAVARGALVVFNSATDVRNVVLATSTGQLKVAGVARYAKAAPAAAGTEGVELFVIGDVPVLNTSGGAITNGATLLSHSAGGVKPRAAEAVPLCIIGEALEDAASGDLFLAYVNIRTQPV